MSTKRLYILDSDIFITAKNRYYAFDICPGFWASMVYHCEIGIIRSVDRVKNELLAGSKTENLVQWVKYELPDCFFLSVDEDEAVVDAYTQIMLWVQQHPRFVDYAKARFAAGADGWLIAYSQVHNAVVITNEQPAPEAIKEIKIPDVCTRFNVVYKDTFALLQELNIRFEWRK